MEDFHNPDGTMRSADDIAALWRQWNILPSQQVAFYCGTGWRASETFMYARAMGWPHVAVYDGAGTNGAATRTIRSPAASAALKAVSNAPRLSASPLVGDARRYNGPCRRRAPL